MKYKVEHTPERSKEVNSILRGGELAGAVCKVSCGTTGTYFNSQNDGFVNALARDYRVAVVHQTVLEK